LGGEPDFSPQAWGWGGRNDESCLSPDYVFANGTAKQKGILIDNANLLPERSQGNGGYIITIDQNLPFDYRDTSFNNPN
jgi:hypothetical protein